MRKIVVCILVALPLLSACRDSAEVSFGQCKAAALEKIPDKAKHRDFTLNCMAGKGWQADGFCKIPGDPVESAACYR